MSESFELDPKIANNHIREDETEFKVRSNN